MKESASSHTAKKVAELGFESMLDCILCSASHISLMGLSEAQGGGGICNEGIDPFRHLAHNKHSKGDPNQLQPAIRTNLTDTVEKADARGTHCVILV